MANIRDVERLRDLLLELGRRRPLRNPLMSDVELELAGPQLGAVMWLGHEGPLTMGELARRLGVTQKGVTGLADRLEGHGYCVREADGRDRRVVRLRLTAQGAEFFKTAASRADQKLAFLLDVLPQTDRDALFRIISRLGAALAELSGDAPSNVTSISKQSSRRKR